MNFASTLRSARAAKKLRQEDVALAMNVSRQTIAFIENERHLPNFALAKRLSEYLGFSLDSISLS